MGTLVSDVGMEVVAVQCEESQVTVIVRVR